MRRSLFHVLLVLATAPAVLSVSAASFCLCGNCSPGIRS